MDPQQVIDKVKEIVGPYLNQNGFELVEITYRRQGNSMLLRLLVDRPGGISAEEYSQINKWLGESLDVSGIIIDRYILEVSSPGLDRPLKNEADFKRVRDKKLRIGLTVPQKGKHELIGMLLEAGQDTIKLELDDKSVLEIAYEQIKYAKLEISFK